MPGALRETKLTDFFQRRPSLLSNNDFPLSSSQSLGPLSSLGGDPTLPIVAKRKPGRPKGSRKRARQTHDEPVQVSSKRVSLPRGTSSPSSRQRPGKPKRGTNKAVKRKEAYPTRLSLDGDSQDSHSIHSPFPSTPQHRPRVSQKENSHSPQAYTPPRLRVDDDNDIGSITSSSVPLSLYYTPQQVSPPGSSRTPDSSLTTDDLSTSLSNKRCYFMSPRVTHCLQAPVTPKGICRNEEIVPTSQSSEVGLYSPVRPDVTSRSKSDVHDSVEIWRHGRGTYRCDVSPLRFVAPNDTGLGSPLSSFTHTDGLSSDIQLNDLPTPLPQHVLPSPTPKPHPTLTPISTPPAVHPVTPPPSSPEQEWPSPVPVVPKDSTTRTAEIIAEIWANVRAKSVSDSEESFLRAPVKDTLSSSSEEEDDEPIFLKRVKTAAHHATLPSLRSPSLPPPSHLPTSSDSDSDESDDQQCVPPFSNSDPISPSDRRRHSTRTRHLANPIKAMLRERKREHQ
ncbi:hypothetical protein BC826DRAFT_341722 [Russula brevipes]|nr:hypothetical protein BC826DRAFT_341722 [Russula brevipes]